MANTNKWLPLFNAAETGDEKAMKSLLAKGEVEIKMRISGETALHVAVFNGHENVVTLLCKNKELLYMRDALGRTPLFTAISKGHVQIVEILCQHGSQVNDTDNEEKTPLIIAIFENNPEIVAILLNHGAIATTDDTTNISPFKEAFENNYQTIVQLLLHSTDLLDICSCLTYPDPEFAEEIFNHCLRKTSAEDCLSGKKHRWSKTPLHFAIFYNRDYQVKRLVESGMDVNIKSRETLMTPLHDAVLSGNIIIVEYLLTKMADINAVDCCGYTPLHYASRQCLRFYPVSEKEEFEDSLEIMKILLKNGASVNTFDSQAKTPLHYAVNEKKFRPEKVRLLLDHNAEVDAHLNEKETPIFYAENAAIVKILIDRGADVNYMMMKDWFTTPLYHAIQEKNLEKVELLLESGADMYVPISNFLFIVGQVQHELIDDIFQTETEINEVIIDRLKDITPIIKMLIKDRNDDRNIIPLLAKRLFQGDVTIDSEEFSSVPKTLSLRFQECQQELERMRDEFKVYKLSLYDFLIMPMKKLRSYTTNEEVLKVLWSGNIIQDKFQVYSSMIIRRFKKAKEERDLLDCSTVALKKFIVNHHKIHLPDLVVYKIIDLLHMVDRKSLAQL